MSEYVSNCHLYLDELHCSDQSSASELYTNGERNNADDIEAELVKPMLPKNWRNVWLRALSSNEIEKRLHVCGSEFGKLFFEAISHSENSLKYSDDKPLESIPLLNISLAERFRRFAKLCEKHDYTNTKSFVVNIECSRDLEDLLQKELPQVFQDSDIFPVSFVIGEAQAKMTLWVATTPKDAVELAKSKNLVFLLDNGIQIDNRLTCINNHYVWAFKTCDAFKNVVRAYIESVLIAPEFMRLHKDFGEKKFGDLNSEEVKEWLTLSQNRPFAYARVPEKGVVENPLSIELGSVGLSVDEIPAFLVMDDHGNRCARYQKEGRMAFTPSRVEPYHVQLGSGDDSRCIIVSDFGSYGPAVTLGGKAPIQVVNHCMTTSVELHDVLGQSCCNATLPTDGRLELTVVAKNDYDDSLTPTDANDWEWELLGEGARVERNGSQITFLPDRAGHWKLRVFWPSLIDGAHSSSECAVVVWKPVRDLSATVDISVLNRASTICVKLKPLPAKGHPPFEVKYMPNKIYAECFPGDGFALSAWLEGTEPLWNRTVRVEGLTDIAPWDDKDREIKKGVKKAGKKEFKVMSADGSEDLVRLVEINYRVNHSDTTRSWMIPCMILSVLSAFCSYGLNWFNFLLYISPMCVAGIHFKLKLPLYRRFMGIMLAIAAILFVRGLWQEVF